jgi:hypothetical protein
MGFIIDDLKAQPISIKIVLFGLASVVTVHRRPQQKDGFFEILSGLRSAFKHKKIPLDFELLVMVRLWPSFCD